MAPGVGLNGPHPGDLLDIERAFTPVHVKLVQAINCGGGIQTFVTKPDETGAQHSAGIG